MPKYIIECEIPGVEKLSERDTKAAALHSNRALAELGPDIQWQHSYIRKDKTRRSVYIARDEKIIQKHEEKIGTPIISITEVKTTWDPTTSD